MTEDQQSVIDKCNTLVNESTSMNIHVERLLEIEAKLAGYYCYLIVEAAKAQIDLNSRYWQRKVGYSREQIKARNAGAKSARDAENLAIEKIGDEINQELVANGDHEMLSAYGKGIEKVMISLAHRIKNLEGERARNSQQVR
jgi:hypothetical protein